MKSFYRILKFNLLFMLVFALSASAEIKAQDVSLHVKSGTLATVFLQISEQTGYKFIYDDALISKVPKVSVQVKNKDVSEVLGEVLEDTGFGFEIIEETVVVSRRSAQSAPANTASKESHQQTIQGRVVDVDGNSLPGATVSVQGKAGSAVVTDANGNFSIVAQEGDIIEASFIGYNPKRATVTEGSSVTILLEPSYAELGEVVVIGYGTMKKRDVTGAVAQVKGVDLKNMPVRNATEALQGKTSGVTVTSTGGSPGTPPAVRIRGIGTVNNNNPLYVVDGLPQTDIGWLNSNDIESMEILKDASASAIYGTRAANGVVMITTKRGKMGGDVLRSNVTFDAYYGIQNPVKTYEMMNASEFMDYKNLANQNAGLDPYFTASQKNQVLDFLRSNFGNDEGTNWWEEINQENAPVQSYNVTLSGGVKGLAYNSSIGYMDQKGIIEGSDYDRISWRTNFDHDLKDWFKLSGNVGIVSESRRNVLEGSPGFNTAFIAFVADPISPVFRTGLSNIPSFLEDAFFMNEIDPNNPYSFYSPILMTNKENPASQVNIYKDNVWKGLQLKGGLAADIQITDYLKYRGSFGLDLSRGGSDGFSPRYRLDNEQFVTDATVSKFVSQSDYWVLENTLTFEKSFDDHNVMVMVGASAEETKYEETGASKQGLVTNDESQRIINAGTINPGASGYKSESALASYFSRAFYSYKNRYLFTANFRRDGSSNFGDGQKWGNFPSFSAGWVFSDEDFMENLTWLTTGKLRASWGQIGNQAIGGGAYRNTYSGNLGYYLFGVHDPYLRGGNNYRGNPNVRWETTEQTDIGVELSLFDGKVDVVADWFQKTTDGMLLNVPLPTYLGFPNYPWTNAGIVENKGLELDVAYHNNDGEFQYTISGNLFTFKNEVISLGGGEPILGGGWINYTTTRTEERMPIGYFYGLKTDGIFQSQAEVDNYFQEGARPGDLRFVDVNSDGKIDNNDRTNIGDPFPDFSYGLNFSSAYKDFDFLVSIQGTVGNEIMNIKKIDMNSGVGWYNAPKDLMKKAWSPTNPSNEQFAINATNTNNLQISDWLVEDGSYMRLKNIQVGYSLPQSVVTKAGINRVRFWAGAYNLLTITNYTGLDPEIGSSSPLSSGVDQGYYPLAKSFMFGINATF
ncbi:TonB-dependent receptor [Albibacterium indicum]|uniref:TonB-dependent receptor n=1 Tax=Albibacterium indicum TaxID=2292082 RepID=UPI0019821A76|nr:TonB-dependent receptor [Pedobacter indicus]